MFELLMAMVGSKRFSALLRPACSEMAYLTLGYMQVGVGGEGGEGSERIIEGGGLWGGGQRVTALYGGGLPHPGLHAGRGGEGGGGRLRRTFWLLELQCLEGFGVWGL